MSHTGEFPLGAETSLEQLEGDPHSQLALLRAHEPVTWLDALDCWLVTRHDLALRVMRDAATFTVEDPRFSTARVLGPSMLSLDGPAHDHHRLPFAGPFRAAQVRDRFGATVAHETARLIGILELAGSGDLRSSFAGPLAATIVTRALGLDGTEAHAVRGWYDAIVAGVTDITRGEVGSDGAARAFAALGARLGAAIQEGRVDSLLGDAAREGGLTRDEVVSNAAVLLFGGIETTEGMIANALLMLLGDTSALDRARGDGSLIAEAIEESLRLEPAAAVVDRYATSAVDLGGARIDRGDLVRVSITAANRDPAVFDDPDRFDLSRGASRRHLAFAQGPHVCLGIHLARLEARTALAALLARLPGLRLDHRRPAAVRGLVFRKPADLHALWH